MENKEQVNSDRVIIDKAVVENTLAVVKDEAKSPINNDKKEMTSYGKFKDSEALLSAYNSLEAEFTKRSQKLKELEIATEIKTDKVTPVIAEPLYQGKDWQIQVADFVSKYPMAQEFSEEIAKLIMTDDALARDKQCLTLALNRVLADKYRHPKDLIGDKDFIDNYVMSDSVIKDKIISDYLDNLSNHRPPELIHKKGEIPLVPPHRPKSIEEAGELATKLLKSEVIKWYH